MATSKFPFVKLPKNVAALFGERAENGRTYRFQGTADNFDTWFDNLIKHVGPVMTPGEVSLYLNVTRPAVHDRISKGNVSAFHFEFSADSELLARRLRENAVICIPYSECVAWRKVRRQRIDELLKDSRREVEAALAEEREKAAREKAELQREIEKLKLEKEVLKSNPALRKQQEHLAALREANPECAHLSDEELLQGEEEGRLNNVW